jgi:phage terminase small subunit
MGGGGRPKISQADKELKGTTRPDREIVPESDILLTLPNASRNLCKTAQNIWKDIGTQLIEKGILTKLDIKPLERYCMFSAMIEDNIETVVDVATDSQTFYKYTAIIKQIESFENNYGLNPLARRKLGFSATPKGRSNLTKMISMPIVKTKAG